ncbi:unnamed protein product [Polarella glacialis]|uniref:Uncharacterized protein n=2 Tax=Polarella glacialis TaxID=89957 RepID=A0A813E4E6_POLGL|nr:unnamed protein product [Polarella glacialis]
MLKVNYGGKTFDRRGTAALAMAEDMLRHKDAITRRMAISCLFHLGKESLEHAADFATALQDEDAGVRYWASVWLASARTRDGSKSKALEHHSAMSAPLSDPDPGIRYWAAEALFACGRAAVEEVPALTTALLDTDPGVRVAAAKALAAVDPEVSAAKAAEVLLEALDSEESYFRASAAEGLGFLGTAAMPHTERLGQALGDSYAAVRLSATKSFQRLGLEAIQPMSALLAKLAVSDPDHEVQATAMACLKKLDLPFALQHEDVELRRWAAEGLAKLEAKCAEHAPLLAAALKDDDGTVRGWVAVAFSVMGPTAAQFAGDLKAALGDAAVEVRPLAMRALARQVPEAVPEALAYFVELLKHDDPSTRMSSIEAIGFARDQAMDVVPSLIECLGDENVKVRLASLEAIASVGQRAVRKADKAIAKLAKTDPDTDVRRAAVTQLRNNMLAQKFDVG